MQKSDSQLFELNPSKRPPVQRQRIVRELRDTIISGAYQPGNRMPTRRELCETYGMAKATVDSAMGRLEEHGFVQSRGRAGTFVAEHLPHLCRYALIFPGDRQTWRNWSRFYDTLEKVTEEVGEDRPDVDFPSFYGVGNSPELGQHRQLVFELANQMIGGLIFCDSPWIADDSDILTTQPEIPRVAFQSGVRKGIPSVTVDRRAFGREAVRHLHEAGCRRLGIVSMAVRGKGDDEFLFNTWGAEFGMTTRPGWHLYCDHRDPRAGESLGLLLSYLPAEERPDGLIISDDNLVEAVTTGLAKGGVVAGRDMEIVAYRNFPNKPSAALPVTWLGFCLHEIVDTLIAAVDEQRSGGSVPELTAVAPCFENELQQTRTHLK